MAEDYGRNFDSISEDGIDAYVRLAAARPDDELLRRFFEVRREQADSLDEPLSESERRWVLANLEENPAWQRSWREWEQALGRPVAWAGVLDRPTQSGAGSRIVHASHERNMGRAGSRIAHARGKRHAGGDSRTSRRPPQAPTRNASRLVRARPAVIVGGTVVLVYGLLWIGSHAALPPSHDQASLRGYEALLSQQARSTGTEAQNAFAEAASALMVAPRSTLGLFPRYDEASVEEAIRHLERAYAATHDPFHRAESAFFLAKSHLMKNDPPEARVWLERVESHQVADYREDARRLIAALASNAGN